MSLSYAPWLRTLVSDMNLSYLSTVKKLNTETGLWCGLEILRSRKYHFYG